jgi:ribose transport system permease protein
MTTATQNPSVRQPSLLANLTAIELMTLASALLMLVAFVILPWVVQGGNSATGLGLLTSAPPFKQDLADSLNTYRGLGLLIPLAALVAVGAAFWGMLSPARRRLASGVIRGCGLLALIYFILFLAQDRQSAVPMVSFVGTGFWLAFFALFGLLFQGIITRPVTAEVTSEEALVGRRGLWDRLFGSLTQRPRFLRTIAFIFRFQSFFGLFIVFILAIIFSPTRSGSNIFLSQRNLSNVTRDVAETGILAVGQLLVIIIGGIDLSVGSVVALTATGGAFLLMRDFVPAIPAILLILGLGVAIGWWNGWTAERFKIPSFVTTLAMLSIARGVAHIWSSDIAVPISYGAGGADPIFELIGERINGIFPVPALIMFGVGIIMALVLHYTAFGRHLYAIGGNQIAARLSGIAVSRIKIMAFMLCSFFAAMAGLIHASQLNQGSPNEAVNYELNAIAAVVIGGASLSGGKGTVAGAIAGAFILGILDNMLSLNNVSSSGQLVTKGLLVVAAVALQQLRPRNVD